MMKQLKALALKVGIVVGVGALSVGAQAAPKLSIFGLGNYNFYSQDVLGVEVRGTIGYGGGVLAEFPISQGMGIEVGGAFQRQRIKGDAGPILGTSTTEADSIHIPAGLRIGSGSSALIGGYYDLSLEDGGEADYGAVAGFRLGMGGLFFEPRFKYGFNDDALDGNMEAQLLIGYTFGGK